ncbi:hypothetical protein K4F52_010235 [Lecanicillium sp. MT-2017a]|nr:hypothetical protein K4F52_010235 [Lecanicillium sp. MT-2017a]
MYEYAYSQIKEPDRDDLVRTALDCTIDKFYIELLQTEVTKPHVVATLMFDDAFQVGDDLVTGCRVSVEFVGLGFDGNSGDCRLAFFFSQCMVRWNNDGLVKWDARKESVSGRTITAGFHEIIANAFYTTEEGQLAIYQLPINCGKFRRGVVRVKKHKRRQLPYNE